ncbi:MAG: hypothetical protein IPN75_05225 [Dechloromonas sp.]|uniref:Uncharacterized protein n=1 Tax=Candidatus Dechloromonas phosphorivorans TaxID=2899244 RepID=A0A9D7LL54_9RHOO|nr:hypothetical protein [Candidatus Dechloromonas phosphorivorans]
MSKKQKLQLSWIGKENRPKLEPRILLEDPAKSYHATHRVASARNRDRPQFAKIATCGSISRGPREIPADFEVAGESAVPEVRLALLDEGGHAFLLVFQPEAGMEGAALEEEDDAGDQAGLLGSTASMKRAVRHRSIALALYIGAITGSRTVLMRSLLRVMKWGRQNKRGPSALPPSAESEGRMLPAEILRSTFFLHTCLCAFGSGWTQLESGRCGRRNLRFRGSLNQEYSFIPLRLDDIKENN